MAVNPNDPSSDPFRPGREAAKRAQDDAAAAGRRFQESVNRTAATTAATIKRNQDILEDNRRRDAFTKQILGSRANWRGGSGVGVGGAVLVLLFPLAFLAVIAGIAFVAWKLLT